MMTNEVMFIDFLSFFHLQGKFRLRNENAKNKP